MGAASAVLVSDDALAGSDSLSTAKVLAKAIERAGDIELVLTATESTDGYTGTIPAQVAELLGWPSLTFAKHVEVGDGKVSIQRQTEAGYDEVEADLPAVVSVTAGVVEPRYPSFKGIMAAKNKPVDQVTVTDLGLSADQVGWAGARQKIVSVGAAPEREAGEKIEDDGEAFAAHRRVPRAAQSRLRRLGNNDGNFQDLGLRRGRRRQADERRRSRSSPRPVSSPTPSKRCTSGANADALAAGLGEHGATKVFAVDPGDALPGVVGAAALADLVGEHSPDAVLFAQSYDGRDAIGAAVGEDRPSGAHQRHRPQGRRRQAHRRHRDLRWASRWSTPSSRATARSSAAIRPKSFAAEPSGGGAAEVVAVRDARRRACR